MKKVAAWLFAASITLPLAACSVSNPAAKVIETQSSSNQWHATVKLSGSSLRSGTNLSARLTLDNRTGHNVKISGCPGDQIFALGLENSRVKFDPIVSSVECYITIHRGINHFPMVIYASYQGCSGGGPGVKLPVCLKGLSSIAPKLPIGRYHTVLLWPGNQLPLPKPGNLWVKVTS